MVVDAIVEVDLTVDVDTVEVDLTVDVDTMVEVDLVVVAVVEATVDVGGGAAPKASP